MSLTTKKTKTLYLNDYGPVTLSSTITKRNTCARMFTDESSEFNPTVPLKLVIQLRHLRLNITLCERLLNVPTPGCTDRHHNILPPDSQHGRPSALLSPPLHSLPTHDCMATHRSDTIIKLCSKSEKQRSWLIVDHRKWQEKKDPSPSKPIGLHVESQQLQGS